MEENDSAASLVFSNDLIRSEIFRACDQNDLIVCALTSKAGFRTAVRLLWNKVPLGEVNMLFTEQTPSVSAEPRLSWTLQSLMVRYRSVLNFI